MEHNSEGKAICSAVESIAGKTHEEIGKRKDNERETQDNA